MITEQIKEDVSNILSSYIDDGHPMFDLSTYEQNKRQFYEEFGNKLIISKPTTVVTGDFARQKVFDDFLSYISIRKDLSLFIRANGIEGFFNNEVVNNYQGEQVKVPVGMKLSKSFKLFIEDNWSLNYAQTKYSQAINNDGLHGDLCLSIHPLDYLSISENRNGWRSCQSLDGEYASGTLSLMNDKATIVAYLANQEKYQIFSSPENPVWNSKKWRMLVHIDKNRNRVMFSKHYPFTCTELEDEVVKMIKELYPNKKWNEKSLITISDKETWIGNTRGRSNYNDITTGSNICFQLTTDEESDKILVGSAVQCLHCGNNDITESQNFACDECNDEGGYCCDDCGDCGIVEDDMYYIESCNRHVCWHCWESNYSLCNTCGDLYDEEHYDPDANMCTFCRVEEEEALISLEQNRQDIQGEHSENN